MAPRPKHITLEVVFERMAALGLLTQLNIVRTEGRYQASLKRQRSSAYGVAVRNTVTEALFDVLGPEPGVSWDDHLNVTVREERTYWHHAASACVFFVEPGDVIPEGDIDELDYEQYEKLRKQYELDDDDFSDLI